MIGTETGGDNGPNGLTWRSEAPIGVEHQRHVLERELVRSGELVGLEPGELADVVGRLRLAADHACRPVEVERRLRGRVAAVAVHPDSEELERLDLEAGLLPQLAAQAVQRVLALLEEAAGNVPAALDRL